MECELNSPNPKVILDAYLTDKSERSATITCGWLPPYKVVDKPLAIIFRSAVNMSVACQQSALIRFKYHNAPSFRVIGRSIVDYGNEVVLEYERGWEDNLRIKKNAKQ